MIEIIERENRIDAVDLRALCIKENWFTGGTNEQYGKLFDMAWGGASLRDLTLVIWLCTPDRTCEEIKSILEKEFGGAK